MNAKAKILDDPAQSDPSSARLSVSCVLVEPMQVWFHCPRCRVALSGLLSDPRGIRDVVCHDCGEEFDVPASANIVIV